jgi:hypothetical protein
MERVCDASSMESEGRPRSRSIAVPYITRTTDVLTLGALSVPLRHIGPELPLRIVLAESGQSIFTRVGAMDELTDADAPLFASRPMSLLTHIDRICSEGHRNECACVDAEVCGRTVSVSLASD